MAAVAAAEPWRAAEAESGRAAESAASETATANTAADRSTKQQRYQHGHRARWRTGVLLVLSLRFVCVGVGRLVVLIILDRPARGVGIRAVGRHRLSRRHSVYARAGTTLRSCQLRTNLD